MMGDTDDHAEDLWQRFYSNFVLVRLPAHQSWPLEFIAEREEGEGFCRRHPEAVQLELGRVVREFGFGLNVTINELKTMAHEAATSSPQGRLTTDALKECLEPFEALQEGIRNVWRRRLGAAPTEIQAVAAVQLTLLSQWFRSPTPEVRRRVMDLMVTHLKAILSQAGLQPPRYEVSTADDALSRWLTLVSLTYNNLVAKNKNPWPLLDAYNLGFGLGCILSFQVDSIPLQQDKGRKSPKRSEKTREKHDRIVVRWNQWRVKYPNQNKGVIDASVAKEFTDRGEKISAGTVKRARQQQPKAHKSQRNR